jgi:branched-chain amino acid transport system ATP-binding protein
MPARAGSRAVRPVLEVHDLTIRFGGLTAVDGLNLHVDEWEIVGLMGPNGAGKTSAFNCITGFYKPSRGRVLYRGQDVTAVPPHRKAALGIGRTFQNVGMVKSETALENLLTAQHTRAGYGALRAIGGGGVVRQRERALVSHAEAILDLLGLSDIRDRRIGSLPYGTLKLLELGCALATDPELLLLDEPSSGMGPEESHELGERLLDLRRELGVTMLLIEHHVPLVAAVCDYVYVLNFGRLLAEGSPDQVRSHPEVIAAYLGGEAPEALAQTEEPEADLEAAHGLPTEPLPVPAPAPAAAKNAPAKNAPAKKTPAKRTPAKKTLAKKAAAKGTTAATKKATTRKTAAAKKTGTSAARRAAPRRRTDREAS